MQGEQGMFFEIALLFLFRGPNLTGRFGPKRPIVFTCIAAAICIGPESFPINTLHFYIR